MKSKRVKIAYETLTEARFKRKYTSKSKSSNGLQEPLSGFVCKIHYQNLLLFLHPLKWHQFVTLVEKRWICLKSWFEEIFLILLNCCWQKICCQISSQFESRIAVRGGIEVWKVCWSLMKKQGIFVKNMFTKDIIVLFTIQ